MENPDEYRIKYMSFLICDIFEYFFLHDKIIDVKVQENQALIELKFVYYLTDIPEPNESDGDDIIEDCLEERIRNSFKVDDAYVFLKSNENIIEILLHDDIIPIFEYEAMVYMRNDKLNELLN